jgi:isocitrate/isopropylmalate dehydrogenase
MVRIAAVDGDNIGPQVVVAGIRVLQAVMEEAVTGQFRRSS